jgi:hypothetical protein
MLRGLNNLRSRLAKLEASQPPGDELAFSWGLLLRALNGDIEPEELSEAEQDELAVLDRQFAEAETEHARCLELQPAGIIYRRELAQLGLPQPTTLEGIDLTAESIRLAGVPGPLPCGLRELPGTPPTTNGE